MKSVALWLGCKHGAKPKLQRVTLKSDDLSLKWILNPPSMSIHVIHLMIHTFIHLRSRRWNATKLGRSRWQEGLILYSAPGLAIAGEDFQPIIQYSYVPHQYGDGIVVFPYMVLIYGQGYRNYNPILMFPNIGLAISFDVVHVIVLSISTNPHKNKGTPWNATLLRAFWQVFSEKSDVTPIFQTRLYAALTSRNDWITCYLEAFVPFEFFEWPTPEGDECVDPFILEPQLLRRGGFIECLLLGGINPCLYLAVESVERIILQENSPWLRSSCWCCPSSLVMRIRRRLADLGSRRNRCGSVGQFRETFT